MNTQVVEAAPRAVAPLPAVATGAIAERSPVGIMMAAMAQGLDPATLREMLALQREWEADEARRQYNAALAAFKAEPVKITKGKLVNFETRDGGVTSYKHAELADVVAAVGPALSRHGFSWRWDVEQARDWIKVTCILKHAAGHAEKIEMGGPPDASGKKNQLQQIASTVSYLQRYTLKALTGVAEAGEDDDGQGGADDADAQQGQQTQQQPAGQQQARPEKEVWPEESFAKQFARWSKAVDAGLKTVDDILAMAESVGTLTDTQRKQITDLSTTREPGQEG